MKVSESVPAHRDPAVIAAVESALVRLASRCPTLHLAVVATSDGFEVARFSSAGEEGADERLSSITSTFQALGEAVVRELMLGTVSHVAVAGTRGSLLVRRIGAQPLTMSAVFAPARDGDGDSAREVANELAASITAMSDA